VADKPSQALLNAQKELQKRRRLAGVSYRPPQPSRSERIQPDWLNSLNEIHAPKEDAHHSLYPFPSVQATLRLSPSLASWCLDKDHRHQGFALDGPYRLYKILQSLDQEGRGWLANSFITPTLTRKESPYYIYGRRQLKNMLRRGEELFWHRIKSKGEVRIRLVSRAKVASRLLDGRLRGREVSFPLHFILGHGRGRQAVVNAALYTAVHAGQTQQRGRPGPISRARLRNVSGCSSYRQRRYEQRMKIRVTSNIHILGRYNAYQLQRVRLYQGLPAYKHTDYQGKINRHARGVDYIALRLPNSYRTPDTFAIVHSRRQRTINRQLGGLCLMGSEGSDRNEYVRLFHENAVAAVQAFNRDAQTTAFCPLMAGPKSQLWHSIG
jgi:hypothetical protein